MLFVSPPRALKIFYPGLVWRINTKEKTIYLTFDDGPVAGITPWVLEQLQLYNAKATFFCIGENIKRHPDIFKSIIAGGHAVGNHTYNHLNGWKTKTADYIANINKCQEQISPLVPHPSSLIPFFRPPYGMITKSQIRHLHSPSSELRTNYSIIMWDVLSYDFDKNILPEKVLHNVISKTKAGSIVVFHDSIKAEKNLRIVLPQVLNYFSEQGFSFERITASQTF